MNILDYFVRRINGADINITESDVLQVCNILKMEPIWVELYVLERVLHSLYYYISCKLRSSLSSLTNSRLPEVGGGA